MNRLIASEWERLWQRKTTWLMFLSIPLILLAAANYLLKQNEGLSPTVAHYTVAWNFPIMALSEMLVTAVPAVILVIVTFIVTDEYQEGSVRMVLIRAYSNLEVIYAKYFISLAAVALFFFAYFLMSYAIGSIFFPKPRELMLFYHQGLWTPYDAFIYNLKFYGIAIITSIALVSTFFFIACVARTTTAALGAGIGFLLLSFAYPNVLSYFVNIIGESVFTKLFFTSITMIQWQGITYMLAENPHMVTWNIAIISSYLFFFTSLTILTMQQKDFFN